MYKSVLSHRPESTTAIKYMARLTVGENFWAGFKSEEEEGVVFKKNSQGPFLGSQFSLGYLFTVLSWASYFSDSTSLVEGVN